MKQTCPKLKIMKIENVLYFNSLSVLCTFFYRVYCTPLLKTAIIYIYANKALKILCKIETNNSYLFSFTN